MERKEASPQKPLSSSLALFSRPARPNSTSPRLLAPDSLNIAASTASPRELIELQPPTESSRLCSLKCY
jgi:hypothetical protein